MLHNEKDPRKQSRNLMTSMRQCRQPTETIDNTNTKQISKRQFHASAFEHNEYMQLINYRKERQFPREETSLAAEKTACQIKRK